MRRCSGPKGSCLCGSGRSTWPWNTGKTAGHERLRADTTAAENRFRGLRQRLRLLLRRQGQRRAAQSLHRLHPAVWVETPHRRISHGLRDPVPRHALLRGPDAGVESRHPRRLSGLRPVQGAHLRLHVPALLAPVGGGQAGVVGSRDAGRKLHARQFPFFQRGDVGLRVPEPVRRVAAPAVRRDAHLLPDRHSHAGEFQPLAHDIQRPQPPPFRGAALDTPMGRRGNMQRLSDLRLADDRRVDGQRTVRVAL